MRFTGNGGDMDSGSSDIYISDIDRERFGFKTARVVGVTVDNLTSILNFCGQEKVELLIARCNMADLHAAQAMEKEGFLLMDTLVFYVFDILKQPLPVEQGIAVVRSVCEEEKDEMLSVARESFRGYVGHYHADLRLDQVKCDEAYSDWAHKAFASRQSDNFLVGDVDGRIVAFGVLRMNSADEGEMFLGGILPEFQGQRIYHSFLCKGVEWCIAKDARTMVISTQLKNIFVQKGLIKFGFEISRGYYTYHKWFD